MLSPTRSRRLKRPCRHSDAASAPQTSAAEPGRKPLPILTINQARLNMNHRPTYRPQKRPTTQQTLSARYICHLLFPTSHNPNPGASQAHRDRQDEPEAGKAVEREGRVH